jgi:hypothetical protein
MGSFKSENRNRATWEHRNRKRLVILQTLSTGDFGFWLGGE